MNEEDKRKAVAEHLYNIGKALGKQGYHAAEREITRAIHSMMDYKVDEVFGDVLFDIMKTDLSGVRRVEFNNVDTDDKASFNIGMVSPRGGYLEPKMRGQVLCLNFRSNP